MKQIRKRLTYANVMSSIAVFIVLGGAAIAASQLPKNSVGTKQLKNNAVTTKKIKKNAVTTAKIKDSAVDGAKVKDGSITAADFAAGTLTPACPSDTVLTQGVCIETAARTVTTYEGANDTCVSAGRRLPSAAELSGFTRKVQAIPAQERSGDLFNTTFSFNVNPDGSFAAISFATATAFRCVAAPSP